MKPWTSRPWFVGLVRGVFWSALAVLMYLAVARPMPGGPSGALSVHDKLVHGGVYGALAVCGLLGRLRASTVMLVLFAHGALVEVLQALVPDRSADVLDLLADALGIAVVLAISHLGRKVFGPSQQTG